MFTVDFPGDGRPLSWSLTDGDPGWTVARHDDYRPTLYAVAARGMAEADPDPDALVDSLLDLRADLAAHPAVERLRIERRRPGFRMAAQPVLRIDVDRVGAVRPVARFVERRGPPGQFPYRAFDVDLGPEFRFCLDRAVSPVPARPPTVLALDLPRAAAAADDVTALSVGRSVTRPTAGDRTDPETVPAGDTERAVVETLRDRLAATDPDVLSVERAALLPLVASAAREHGVDLGLGRVPPGRDAGTLPGLQRLAGDTTYESYGQVHHSPARYNVPGRVVIDRSNTFFLGETGVAGALDLVERARKPLQELSWASIGAVLTAIQIREARRRDVLVQWRAWRPERFKTAAALHDADRGGTTLSPVVGLHETVHELDFASLYPSIIREHNLSPETVRCRCHDRADVPELGYSVCDREGFLPEVLAPIIDDRAAIKRRLAGADLTDRERADLAGRSSALKWILVSCFGYQGFSNAKFGRIEVHEAINAYAREILLTAKERLEAAGWRVLHGIVDSIWVTPREGADPEPVASVAADVSDAVGIDLEYEAAFEWVAFCPRRDGDAGALTRYVGKRRDGDYKLRGIECRQRSTCAWVGSLQRELLDVLDAHRDPAAVCDRLRTHLRELGRGDVAPSSLAITTRVSTDRGAYTRETRTVAALDRAAELGESIPPGQSLSYVVVDDDAAGHERVRLAREVSAGTGYDAAFYRERAIRAAASVCSPLGWDRERVRRYLADTRERSLAAF